MSVSLSNIYSLRWLMPLGALLALSTCAKPPQYAVEPSIEYIGLSKTRIYQGLPGFPIDTLYLRFSFTDGDGDISFPADSLDIFLTDSRNPDLRNIFRFPVIPVEGTGNGISGEVTIRMANNAYLCCIYQDRICVNDPAYPVDTLSYSIQIRDRAGNLSNSVRTERIELLCGQP